ncbi:polymorphic toxin-type HINT domain-containing protein [Streptomyces adustus]|uniref:polymorphic toxin-type HINT domain-containing protein n=1 Tax=Streptomyces adustus TaxID=1609272 RepID=UPI0035DFB530
MAMGCGGGEPIAGEDADSPPAAGGSGGSGEAPKASADAAPHEAGSGSGDAAAASGAGKESSTDSAGSNAAAPKKADAQSEASASSKSAASPDKPSTGNSGTTNKGSGGGSRCSFSPSTSVLMAGGKTKASGKIKTGDKVESADPRTGKHKGARTVQHIWINHDKDLLDVTVRDENGHQTTLHTTANHPFWDDTSHSWKPAGELRRGDALNTADDGHAYVVGTRVTAGAADRWNLTVRELHTYYVLAGTTPVLVHNTDGPICDLNDGYLYRGLAKGHHEYDTATEGRAVPRGTQTSIDHHTGGNATDTIYTSWSDDPEVAQFHGENRGEVYVGEGVMLRVKVDSIDRSRIFQVHGGPYERFFEDEHLIAWEVLADDISFDFGETWSPVRRP